MMLMGPVTIPLVQNVCLSILDAKLKRLFRSATLVIMAVINVILSIILVRFMGFWGAALGTVISLLVGSAAASLMRTPKRRVKAIWGCLLLSMGTENLLLALGKSLPVWCIGAFLGWIAIPLMNANLDAVNRLTIPEGIQGRVFAARNSFQFFTIPVGYFLGGWLVDRVFEPLMAAQGAGSLLIQLFGSGKGSGAAMCFGVLWMAGIGICMVFRCDRHIWQLENKST